MHVACLGLLLENSPFCRSLLDGTKVLPNALLSKVEMERSKEEDVEGVEIEKKLDGSSGEPACPRMSDVKLKWAAT